MLKLNRLGIAFTACLLLSGCGNSQWKAHYDKAEKALASNAGDRLAVAEKELMTAVELGWKDKVPEKDFVCAYEKLGNVLMEEQKYDESQKYILRTIQFGNALKIGVDKNIALLRKLVFAYEKSRDYEQAAQTQDVLVHLIEFEKSPMDPTYKSELAKNESLKLKVAQFNRPVVKVAENPDAKPDTSAIDSNKQAQLLQGWH